MKAYRDPTPLEVAERRNRELEKLLADERIEGQRREESFRNVLNSERQAREEGYKRLDDANDRLHNRRMTLESVLKTVRRLTNDPEILTVTRLALVGDQPLHE